MSITESIIILLISALILKPKDLTQILNLIHKISTLITYINRKIYCYIEKIYIKKSKKDCIAFYLNKITNLDYKYKNKYSLDEIKTIYYKLLKKYKNNFNITKTHKSKKHIKTKTVKVRTNFKTLDK